MEKEEKNVKWKEELEGKEKERMVEMQLIDVCICLSLYKKLKWSILSAKSVIYKLIWRWLNTDTTQWGC